MGDTGLEQLQQYSIFDESVICAAIISALEAHSHATDIGLTEVLAGWSNLTSACREEVLAIMRACSSR